MSTASRAAGLCIAISLAVRTAVAAAPPDPWPLLYGAEPRTPPLDAPLAAVCREPARVAALGADISTLETRADRVEARRKLAPAMHSGEDETVRACAELASARLALALGLLPEASADALACSRRAEALGDPLLVAAARFVRGEAQFFAGRDRTALENFEAAAKASDPRLAAAARLRIAEVQLEQGSRARALAVFRELLGPDSPLVGVPLGAFALRAAELAWSEGEEGEAARWVEQALGEPLAPHYRIAATLRRADLLAAAGRGAESEEQFAAVAASDATGMARRLIDVRRAERSLADPSFDRAALEALLVPAIESANLPLSSYARSVEVAARLANDDPATAFDDLLPLLTESRSVSRLGLERQLDAVLTSMLADPERCPEAIARLDAQRTLIVRMAPRGEPLAALGDCYQRVGLVEPALAILRAASERFGPAVGALALARTSLRGGEGGAAASAARDRIAANASDADLWRLLLAEVELSSREPVRAAELLLPLVESAPGPDRTHAVVLLGQAAGSGRLPDATVDVLAAALAAQEDAAWRRSGGALADTALVTANLLRRAGRVEAARPLYALASAHATQPAPRAEAFYWRGRLAPSHAEAREQLQAATAAEDGAWSELARGRKALLDLGYPGSGGKRG